MSLLTDDGSGIFPATTRGSAPRVDGATFDDEQMVALDSNGMAGPNGVQVVGVAQRPAPDGPVGFGEGISTFRGDGTVSASTRPGATLYRVDPHTLSATPNGKPAARFWAFDPINFPDRPVLALVGRIIGAQLAGL